MSAVMRTVLRAPVAQTAIQSVKRSMTTAPGFTYGPPRVRISIVEKYATAGLMVAGVLAGPVYISLQLPKYRKEV